MADFDGARERMVNSQVRIADVTDRVLIAAMGDIPRERFVPSRWRPFAYIDEDVIVKEADAAGPARYLMEPGPFARLVQMAAIGPEDVVLDVGCATGYSAAIIARLASSVVALESDPGLAEEANERLLDLGVDNVAVVTGPLVDGYPSEGPYDVIVLEGAVEAVPQALFDQLKDGGRLVGVVGSGRAAVATLYSRTGRDVAGRGVFDAHVRPLPGFEKPQAFVF